MVLAFCQSAESKGSGGTADPAWVEPELSTGTASPWPAALPSVSVAFSQQTRVRQDVPPVSPRLEQAQAGAPSCTVGHRGAIGWLCSELAPGECVLVPHAPGHPWPASVCRGSAGSRPPVQPWVLQGLLHGLRVLCSQACNCGLRFFITQKLSRVLTTRETSNFIKLWQGRGPLGSPPLNRTKLR